MNTEAIQTCINCAPDFAARAAAEQLKALDESHADLARALLSLLPEEAMARNHTRECLKWRTDGGYVTECLPGCVDALAALRKAGAL